ncbi:MAG: TatD family hydrolase [Gemmatimonadales bacterium]
MLIDTHCHLASDAFADDLDAVLERAWAAGVGHLVVIGEQPESAARAVALAVRDRRISATAGLHPHEAARWTIEMAEWLRHQLADPRVVAAGEMGLDYHYDHAPRDVQRTVFEAQLALAVEAGKPVVIHAREADDDVGAILRNQPTASVILHSFSSGPGLLRTGLDLGHYLSFSGMVTFRNWRLDEAIRAAPANRLLLETDAPYLAPVPERGTRNEPAFVRFTAARVASVRGEAPDAVVAQTTANARRLFGPRLGE